MNRPTYIRGSEPRPDTLWYLSTALVYSACRRRPTICTVKCLPSYRYGKVSDRLRYLSLNKYRSTHPPTHPHSLLPTSSQRQRKHGNETYPVLGKFDDRQLRTTRTRTGQWDRQTHSLQQVEYKIKRLYTSTRGLCFSKHNRTKEIQHQHPLLRALASSLSGAGACSADGQLPQ